MANNRLYICCIQCGEKLYLDKNFCNPYWIGEKKLEELNEFFENHAWCRGERPNADGGSFCLLDEYDREDLPQLLKAIRKEEWEKWEKLFRKEKK